METEQKEAAKPAPAKEAAKPAAKVNPFAAALKSLKEPKGHKTGPHGPDNEKYDRQRQLLADLNELFNS